MTSTDFEFRLSTLTGFLFGILNNWWADKAPLFAIIFPHSQHHTFLNMSDHLRNVRYSIEHN